MTISEPHADTPIATIDVRELQSIRWTFLRQMFPKFAEDVELGRYLRTLMTSSHCGPVRVEAHRSPEGQPSTHIFDVYQINESVRMQAAHPHIA
jgi:hypothetical protein